MRLFSSVAAQTTPAMKQWAQLKKQTPNHLLLFRVGDFYEAFHADAVELSRLLNLQLTHRGIKGSSTAIPMAGVPQHAIYQYVGKLKAQGRSVALADQMETPEEAARAGRRIVKREITRIITPGTAVDDELLEMDATAYLGALANTADGKIEAMWTDVSSGNGGSKICRNVEEGVALLLSVSAQEVLLCPGVDAAKLFEGPGTIRVVESEEKGGCAQALRSYISRNSGARRVSLGAERTPGRLRFDLPTRQALDLSQSCLRVLSSGGHRVQPATARLLRERAAAPLNSDERQEIESRLEAVQSLLDDRGLLRALHHALTTEEMFGDAERALQRLALGSVHRSQLSLARDLRSVALALQLYSKLKGCFGGSVPSARWNLEHSFAWVSRVLATVDPGDPLGLVAGADEQLDQLRDAKAAERELAELETQLSAELGVAVRLARGRGEELFFSVANSDAEHVANLSRQALKIKYVGQRAHTTRWCTDELEKLGRRLAHRERHAEQRAQAVLHELSDLVVAAATDVKQSLMTLFDLDLTVGVASAAVARSLSVPRLSPSQSPLELELRGLFHPAVAAAHTGGAVVANDVRLEPESSRVAVVTGANMSGKSTLLRAVVLAAWMTQCGLPSAVAPESRFALFNAMFVRVGSTDDISRDKSSFMMEMLGVAAVLREEGPLLCALDELGRSTCPEDGSAICAALVRRMSTRPGALTLLSTHFHLEKLYSSGVLGSKAALFSLQVLLRDGSEPLFTYKLASGHARDSLAFAVAKMAGVDEELIADAKNIKKMRD